MKVAESTTALKLAFNGYTDDDTSEASALRAMIELLGEQTQQAMQALETLEVRTRHQTDEARVVKLAMALMEDLKR